MSKQLTVTPAFTRELKDGTVEVVPGTQTVRDLTAAEIAERDEWQERGRPARELSEKRARFSELRAEILDALAVAETPDPAKIDELKTLKTELGL